MLLINTISFSAFKVRNFSFFLTLLLTLTVGFHSFSNNKSIGVFEDPTLLVAPPSNNQCATATSLPCGTTNLAGTTVGTSSFTHGTGCTMANYGVWYTFTGDGNLNTISATTTSYDIEMSIASGTCGSLTNITCQDIALSSGTETYSFTAILGTTYYVYIAYYGSGGTTTGTFKISRTCATPFNPCTTIPNIATCGTTTNVTLAAGSGAYSTSSCGWSTPGTEQLYTYTPTITGNYSIQQASSFAFIDYQFKTAASGCNSTGWTCIDDISGAGTSPTFSMTAGTQYYLLLDPESSAGGSVSFMLNCPAAAPSNNQCATATSLPCGTTNLAGTTVGASSYAYGTTCSMSTNGVWYTFVGDGNQSTITATTTSFDIEMSIASGSCGSLSTITCQDSVLSSGSESYTFTTTLGTNYYVYIAYWTTGTTTGTFTISRTCTTAFNPCTTIPNIAACGTTTNVTLAAGSGAYSTSSCGWSTPGTEQLYTFTPTITGNYSIQQATSFAFIDYQFKPAASGCNSTGWTCIDDISGAGTSPTFSMTGGTQYYILLDPESSAGGSVSFVLNCPVAGPANDDCTGAISLTINATSSCATSTSGTTIGASQSLSSCAGTADDDVWFSFVATGTSHTVTVTPGSLSDAVFQVYNGSCGAFTSLACIDNTVSSAETTTLTGLSNGVTYYVRLHSYGSSTGQGTFTICVTTTVSCTSGNGTGISSLGCPSVTSGGLGLNGADPAPITCTSSSCVDLEANYLALGQTTSYTVESIPYAPPYQYGCLANAVSINIDDVWSSVVNLPFNFCFYGNSYSSCIIGSNGMLSFNTANASSPSGYEYNNNLPSTIGKLFANTIYGVYHDIDPSEGGEVGWELITLNSGCRALVASWSDVPMYYDNSILYTGMMVLYEKTNVIEVYIKEKNIDSYSALYSGPWNNGNAIVGIQNADASQAVVAPGRNGLDNNWTTTNEAWRFVPSGPSITSIKWYEGAGTSGTVVGNTDTINVCPASTTVYTAEVTYTLCNGATVKETDQTTVTVTGSKVWNGSVNTDWNVANNWTPTGVPTNLDCVVIPNVTNDPIIYGTSYNAYGYNLTVLNGGNLTLNSGNNITITDFVKVNTGGIFTIKNSGNLIQINNTANTGNITMERTTNIRQLDYVYWSSPVANFNVDNITAPIASGAIYKWNTTVTNNNGGQGNWESAAGNTMLPAKGYIVGGPGTFSPSVASTLLGTFNGVPNNGIISTTIYRGSDQNTSYHAGINGTEINNYSDNWNLLGNPYPSSIRGSQFLFNNNIKIMGQIRLWTHGTLPAIIASPFYDTFIYNYNPGDYFTYNFTGTSCCPAAASDLFIGAGQGFFVQMIDGPTSSDTVSFNNALRNESYANTTFYKNTNQSTSNTNNLVDIERNRIWLDLLNSNNESDRMLVGYIEGATMATDSFFDAGTLAVNNMNLYSLIGNDKFVIQGRSIPFNPNDIVPLGIKTSVHGSYTIAIGGLDGLFENPNRNIYLEDTETGNIQNLRVAPYTFTINGGTNNTRFKLRYKYSRGNNSKSSVSDVVVSSANKEILVQSFGENMQQISVYDMVGRSIFNSNTINNTEFIINNVSSSQQTLIIKVTLESGKVITKKLIN